MPKGTTIPTETLRAELDFAASVGAVTEYRIQRGPGPGQYPTRRVVMTLPNGEEVVYAYNKLGHVLAFVLGVRAATAAREGVTT